MSDLAPSIRPALAAFQRGELSEAERLCRDAIDADEGSVDAYQLLATIHLRHGRHREALACYDDALALRADDLQALSNRAVALGELGRHEEALASCDQALALRSDYLPALANRGNALRALDRLDEALATYDEALALSPKFPEALSNRGTTLHNLQRYDEAVDCYDRAIALRPDYAQALSNRGLALQQLGRFPEALASYDKALALNAAYPDCHVNKGLLLLLLGRFREGWREWEWRRQAKTWTPGSFVAPEWRGDELHGRRLLLYAEQGYGDTIQFARFARLFAERGAEIILEVSPALARLMQGLAGAPRIVSRGEPSPAVHYHLPLASVPFALGLDEGQIPARVPYLRAEPKRVEDWGQRLPAGEFRIGIAWQGNPRGEIDRGRSVPLAAFAPLAQIPGVRLVSLQKYDGVEQLTDLPAGMQVDELGPQFDAGPEAFLDTAAAMAHLDLIVSSDSAVAHLAGALGRPVWVVLRDVPDWRWLLERADSSWYPTARLFRQTAPGDWNAVFAQIAAALVPLVAQKKNAAMLPPPADAPADGTADMPGFVISLARRSDRRERFARWNSGKGIDIRVFDAVDGQTLNRKELLNSRVIDAENINFNNGALGLALSHRRLWQFAVQANRPLLVFEDDALLSGQLAAWKAAIVAELTERCDLLYLGYNLDVVMSLGFAGSHWCNMLFEAPRADFENTGKQYTQWSSRESHTFVDVRLVWGTLAYAVSPRGAAILLKECFPLTARFPVQFYGQNRVGMAYGIDGVMNSVFQRGLIRARAAFPPLVIGPNDQSDSDVNPRPQPAARA